MEIIKTPAFRVISELSGALRGHNPAKGLRILMYHAVGTQLEFDAKNILSVSPELFRRQMEFLKNSAAFKPVPLGPPKEIYDHTDIAVTFDDGYLDILTQAAPILDKYAIPFTVFVTPELAEKGNPRYLNKTQIAEISKLDGCAIGAHGMTHCPLAACPQDKLEAELKDSKKWIEDAISKEVAAIAYPYGSVCAKTAREAERAGYQLGVCSKTGINAGGANLLALRRTEIFSRESMRMFYLKLAGFWDWHGLIR